MSKHKYSLLELDLINFLNGLYHLPIKFTKYQQLDLSKYKFLEMWYYNLSKYKGKYIEYNNDNYKIIDNEVFAIIKEFGPLDVPQIEEIVELRKEINTDCISVRQAVFSLLYQKLIQSNDVGTVHSIKEN